MEATMFSRLIQVTLVAQGLAISNHVKAAPLAYGTYYDETIENINCSSASTCRVNFSQLPADRLLMVNKINCTILSSQPLTNVFFRISATLDGSPVSSRFLPIALPPSQLISGGYFTNFREDAHYLVGNGRFPYVLAQTAFVTTTNFTMACTMIGDLVAPDSVTTTEAALVGGLVLPVMPCPTSTSVHTGNETPEPIMSSLC
jgi:hypothetical protein